jgi:hypothetical protein
MYHGKHTRPYQAQALWNLAHCIDRFPGETFTVMFPRQAGKNEVSAWLVVDRLVQFHRLGGSIVVAAPTLQPQALLSFQRTLVRLRTWAGAFGIRCWTEGTTIHCGAATATFLSGSPEANVAGHTASILLIGDEAQDLDEEWFNRQFRPMTASTGAPTVLFGTPWRGDSLLEKAVARNRQRDLAHAHDSVKPWVTWHYEVPWETIGPIVEPYADHVRQQRELLGAANPIYLTQYELQSGADEARLFAPDQLAVLRGEFTALSAPSPGERYCGGLDLAGDRGEGDYSVLTIARVAGTRCEVVDVRRWRGLPFVTVQAEVAAAAREWALERLVCDGTGLGAPIAAALQAELGRSVHRFAFSAQSKSELGFELLAAAGTGSLAIAPALDPDGLSALWEELRICQVERRARETISWSAPQGKHDDCVVSLALCLRASKSLGAPRVAKGRSRGA